ncbi:MAG: hypothetical protein A2451_12435 [Bdellovibrionales bacterium RIFOXYC2_FULL_39_8]|nr:MAG: hypothetical protein A2485_04765 [Bdellovibrionales bacterium RIFOXYC12_FULL_39_17]OFZ69479.1 MAG: hypothetical protein A2451_12435 [Bdellovibrionales bacterium RIFOXYC2_FULL_39_8]HLE12974.1 hypothetical protein [Bacteriovoracaceae bacterium]
MDSVFIPSAPYLDILRNVGQWKIIGLRKLFGLGLYKMTLQGFGKQVNQLERAGLIASFRGRDRMKYLYLTPNGGKLVSKEASTNLSDETLTHDLICSNALIELLKYKNFVAGNLIHDDGKRLLAPDGVIYAIKGEREYTCALEIELTQKSSDRIKQKLVRYANSSVYTHVLYVANKMSLVNFFNGILEQLSSEVRSKIVLLLDRKLSTSDFDYQNAQCWIKGEERSFESIFG